MTAMLSLSSIRAVVPTFLTIQGWETYVRYFFTVLGSKML